MNKQEMIEYAINDFKERHGVEPELVLIDTMVEAPYGLINVDTYYLDGTYTKNQNVLSIITSITK